MLGLLRKFFSCRFMLKQEHIVGEIPPTKSIYRNMLRMAWPSAAETVLVSMISSVDIIMVGVIGAAAIAAVGLTAQPRFIVLAFIMSLNVGVTAVVARRRGEKDRQGANRCLKQALLFSGILSLLLSAAGYIWAKPIFLFAGAEDDTIGYAVQYFRISMFGIFPTAISLTINAAQRGAGNTKVSMRTNLAANVVNLIFNYILINGKFGFPRLEVGGAAIATVLGNFVACFLSIKSVAYPDGFLHLDFRNKWSFDKQTVFGLFNIGSSAFVEQMALRIGFFLFAKIVATLGTIAFATHQISLNILSLSFSFGEGLAIAASALVGQNLGAKRPDLAIVYGKTAQRMAIIVSTVIFFIFTFGGKYLVMLFSREPEIIKLGGIIMIIASFVTHAQTSQVVISGCLRGAGDTLYVAISSFLSTAVLRPILSYFLCFTMGLHLPGAWLAMAIDQYLRFIANFMRFSGGKWTKIKV